MGNNWFSAMLLLLLVLVAAAGAQTVNVTEESCDQQFHLDETGTVTLEYSGAYLGTEPVCTLKFFSEDRHNDLCVARVEYANACKVRLEYHEGLFKSSDPDLVFCHTAPPSDWCSSFTDLFIIFERKSANLVESDVNIRLQIRTKSTKSPEHNPSVFSLSVLMGIIGVAVFIVVVLVVVIVLLHCHRKHAQTPSRRPQTALRTRTRHTPMSAGEDFADLAGAPDAAPSGEVDAQPEPMIELATRGSSDAGVDNPAFEENPQNQRREPGPEAQYSSIM